jgi:hypothetical protein
MMKDGDVVEHLGDTRVFRPQQFLNDGQCALIYRLRLCVFTFVLVEGGEIVESIADILVFRPQ